MPKKAQSSTPKQPSPDHIDSETLSIIDRLAQDEDGTILAGAQLIQATHKHLGIRTIYLRGPSNPRVMDRRIPVPTSPDDTENPGTSNKRVTRATPRPSLERPTKQTRSEHPDASGPAGAELNSSETVNSSGKVSLPPTFKKRERRERNVPNQAFAVPSTPALPTHNRGLDPLPSRPSSRSSQQRDDASPPGAPLPPKLPTVETHRNSDLAARPVSQIQPIHAPPRPNSSHIASYQHPITPNPSNTSSIRTPQSNTPLSQDDIDRLIVDDITRAQLLDWYLRAGPMTQELRALKKRRDRK